MSVKFEKYINAKWPKLVTGVRLPHYVVHNRLNWQWNRFPYSKTERTCVFKTSLTFVDSVAEIWAPLLHDEPRCLIVVSKAITKDPERLINVLHENKVPTLKLYHGLINYIVVWLLRAVIVFVKYVFLFIYKNILDLLVSTNLGNHKNYKSHLKKFKP